MMAAHPTLRSLCGFHRSLSCLAAITLLCAADSDPDGTVRGAERSTSAATEVGERTEQYSRTQAFLREHLAGCCPCAGVVKWATASSAGRADSPVYLAPITFANRYWRRSTGGS